jgi:hypothetical protein
VEIEIDAAHGQACRRHHRRSAEGSDDNCTARCPGAKVDAQARMICAPRLCLAVPQCPFLTANAAYLAMAF